MPGKFENRPPRPTNHAGDPSTAVIAAVTLFAYDREVAFRCAEGIGFPRKS
jgi:hypothetical protein